MTTNTTTIAQTCAAAGGVWPAFQAFAVFLIGNIFAHAATIHQLSGATGSMTVICVYLAILSPVTAGDKAFRSLARWHTRLKQERNLRFLLQKETYEDATMSGAIAILIPIRFAPLVSGRWEEVADTQAIKFFNNARFSKPRNPGPNSIPRYCVYVLPPSTKFPGFSNCSMYPSSCALSQVIALVQVTVSVRQLYLSYSNSVVKMGLASPYIIVIPYLLMSLVNL